MGAHSTHVQIMVDARNPDSSPRVRQTPGPLEGYRLGATDIPVRIFDLTAHGCLVEMSAGTVSGSATSLQIDLPGEGWTLDAETLYLRDNFGFAVRFVDLTDANRCRIERTIERLLVERSRGRVGD